MGIEVGVILAAGRGSRMGELTLKSPKPLLPNAQDNLLSRQIDFLRPLVQILIVTHGYLGNKVKAHALSRGADITIDTSGRGNCFFLQSPKLAFADKKRIVVVTCDNLMNCDLDSIYEFDKQLKPGISIVGVRSHNFISGDQIKVQDNLQIDAIGPRVNSNLVASGLQVVDYTYAKGFNIEDFSLLWSKVIENGSLRLSPFNPISWSAFDTKISLQEFPNSQIK